MAVRSIRRERRSTAVTLMTASLIAAVVFLAAQGYAMTSIAIDFAESGPSKGVAGMVFALALLHALHVVLDHGMCH